MAKSVFKNMKNNRTPFGHFICGIRETNFLTQLEFALMIGFNNQAYVSKIETGQSIMPVENFINMKRKFHLNDNDFKHLNLNLYVGDKVKQFRPTTSKLGDLVRDILWNLQIESTILSNELFRKPGLLNSIIQYNDCFKEEQLESFINKLEIGPETSYRLRVLNAFFELNCNRRIEHRNNSFIRADIHNTFGKVPKKEDYEKIIKHVFMLREKYGV